MGKEKGSANVAIGVTALVVIGFAMFAGNPDWGWSSESEPRPATVNMGGDATTAAAADDPYLDDADRWSSRFFAAIGRMEQTMRDYTGGNVTRTDAIAAIEREQAELHRLGVMVREFRPPEEWQEFHQHTVRATDYAEDSASEARDCVEQGGDPCAEANRLLELVNTNIEDAISEKRRIESQSEAPADPTPKPTVRRVERPIVDLANWTSYRSKDYLHVVGSVENGNDEAVQFVKVNAVFYDATGMVVDTDFTYGLRSAVPAGESTPFRFMVSDPSQRIERFTLRTEAEWGDRDGSALGLHIQNMGSTRSERYLTVVGEVVNERSTVARFVKVVGSIHNETGVVEVDFTYTGPTEIPPGGSAGFKLMISHRGIPINGAQIHAEAGT